MGFPSKGQVVAAVERLTFKANGSLIRTMGLWHVLMFLRHRACNDLRNKYTFNAYDLAQASFDVCGIKLPDATDARRTYFEPGASGGSKAKNLFRNRDGPRQTFLNRMYSGLEGSGPRQPKLFKASAKSLPTKLNLQTDWIETLRSLPVNVYILDEQTANLVTWLFRFGIPTKGNRPAFLTKAGANGTLATAEGVTQQPIPATGSEIRTALKSFLGLDDAQASQLFPKLEETVFPLFDSEDPIPNLNISPEMDQTFFTRSRSSLDTSAPVVKASVSQSVGAEKNIIFYGPPGTGKSRLANETAKAIGAHTFRVLFHPEFTYGDFVGSYRPVVGYEPKLKIRDRSGKLTPKPVSYFEFVPGMMAKALRAAFADPTKQVVLIIEEINRGVCAAIFGDLFQLLDRDPSGRSKYGIDADSELMRFLAFDGVKANIRGNGQLCLPANLSFYATMNTSDQSLFGMDAAFKRRWFWEPCHVNCDELKAVYKTEVKLVGDVSKEVFDWAGLLKALNERIAMRQMEDKQIGPWFLLPNAAGLVTMRDFSNKCLFYVWHDIFKDDRGATESPFNDDGKTHTFAQLQARLDKEGLRAILKEDVMREFASVSFPADAGSVPEPSVN
jgi:hypothetical protein